MSATAESTERIKLECGEVPWTAEEWERIRNVRGRLKRLYEDAGSDGYGRNAKVRCVLCDKLVREHPFAMTGHGHMHARRGEAVPYFSARDYRIAPTAEELATAPTDALLEERDTLLERLRSEVKPLSIVRRRAVDRAKEAETSALEAIRQGTSLDAARTELLEAERELAAADAGVEAKLAEYPKEVHRRITMGDLSGWEDED